MPCLNDPHAVRIVFQKRFEHLFRNDFIAQVGGTDPTLMERIDRIVVARCAERPLLRLPWVWCSLENYGGNPSMDGELQNMIDQLTLARESAHYLRGIGMISEASLDNPAVYNMLFDMAWESFTAEEWLESYVTAR